MNRLRGDVNKEASGCADWRGQAAGDVPRPRCVVVYACVVCDACQGLLFVVLLVFVL